MSKDYVRGDSYTVCARCGRRKRLSECARDWDGLFVCLSDLDGQHPQDFVRGRRNTQRPQISRPEGTDFFFGNTEGGIPIGIALAITTAGDTRDLG